MLFTFSNLFAAAQKSRALHITGQIRCLEGELIGGASIVVNKGNTREMVTAAVSDEKGNFLCACGPGRYYVVISSAGYAAFVSGPITIMKDTGLGIVTLQHATQALAAVVIKAAKEPPFIKADARKLTYSLDKTVDAEGSNALEALRKIPGLAIDQNNVITSKGGKSVLVMINGRQTYLPPEEIGLFLKSLPSGSIKSIEVIDNPSSEYDAAGSGGVINIVLQKNFKEGWNGSFTAGLAYGISLKANSDGNFSYRQGKLNIFGNYGNMTGHFAMDYSNDRTEGGISYINPIHDVDKRNTTSTVLGSDYEINKNRHIGLFGNGNFIYGTGLISPDTYIYDSASKQLLRKLVSTSDYYHTHENRYDVNANYRYEDSLGRMLSVDVDYGYFDEDTRNLNTNTWLAPDDAFQSRELYRSLNSKEIHMAAFSANTQHKLWKGKYQAGVKFSGVTAGNDFDLYSVVNNTDVIDTGNSNFYKYTERIAAAYMNYEGQLCATLRYDLGLRMENTCSIGRLTPVAGSSQPPSGINRNYTDLFPTASVTLTTPKAGSFSLSYAKRIDRPAYKYLSPFEYPIDELSYWKGNPFLQPQYAQTVAFRVSYAKTIVELEYTYTSQLNIQVTDVFDQDKIALVPENAGSQRNLSLHVTRQLSPVKGWNVSLSGIGYFLENQVTIGQYGSYNPKKAAGSLTTQQSFKMPGQITAELDAAYNTRTLSAPIGISRGNSQVDLGLQKNIMKGKALLRLTWTDIYQGNKSNTTSDYRGLMMHEVYSGEYRQIKLNVTYKFGHQTTDKPLKEHDSGLKSENERL